jgi:hypothetical protein
MNFKKCIKYETFCGRPIIKDSKLDLTPTIPDKSSKFGIIIM